MPSSLDTIDAEAHRLASEMTAFSDPAAVSAYAAALQALLAYRATYHAPAMPEASSSASHVHMLPPGLPAASPICGALGPVRVTMTASLVTCPRCNALRLPAR